MIDYYDLVNFKQFSKCSDDEYFSDDSESESENPQLGEISITKRNYWSRNKESSSSYIARYDKKVQRRIREVKSKRYFLKKYKRRKKGFVARMTYPFMKCFNFIRQLNFYFHVLIATIFVLFFMQSYNGDSFIGTQFMENLVYVRNSVLGRDLSGKKEKDHHSNEEVAKVFCEPHDNLATNAICTCGSETPNGCAANQFCWSNEDAGCHDHALCVPDDTNAIAANNCQCASTSTTAECDIGNFCLVGNVCSTADDHIPCTSLDFFCEHNGTTIGKMNDGSCSCECTFDHSGDHCENHPLICPQVGNPCDCGPDCGWNPVTGTCDVDDITSCAECSDVCIPGTCQTFENACPMEFDQMLNCQCDMGCEERGDCCSDAGYCPNEEGCSRTDDACGCSGMCGWDFDEKYCSPHAITSCEECSDVCVPGICQTFTDSCPTEFNELLNCQCDEGCEIREDCCNDFRTCPQACTYEDIKCEHGGAPWGFDPNCYCICPEGYTGFYCQNHPGICGFEDIQCENGGHPHGIQGNCHCDCEENFSGDLCEIQITCTFTCQNGGQLINPEDGNCSCECARNGYTGDECEVLLPCSDECQNGGTTTGDIFNCGCDCVEGYTGDNCEIIPLCTNECHNEGTSVGIYPDCACDCVEGFTGDDCEILPPCTHWCYNGGTLEGAEDYYCTCSCPWNFLGDECRDQLACTDDSIACQNGGSPSGNQPDCSCTCTEDYVGDNCEIYVPSECFCEANGNFQHGILFNHWECFANDGSSLGYDEELCEGTWAHNHLTCEMLDMEMKDSPIMCDHIQKEWFLKVCCTGWGNCADGIQNNFEDGVDCGGSCDNACEEYTESETETESESSEEPKKSPYEKDLLLFVAGVVLIVLMRLCY